MKRGEVSVRELAYALQQPGVAGAFWSYRDHVRQFRLLDEALHAEQRPDWDLDQDVELLERASRIREGLDRARSAIDMLVGRGFGVSLRTAEDRAIAAAELEPEILSTELRRELPRRLEVAVARAGPGPRAANAARLELGRELGLTPKVLAHARAEAELDVALEDPDDDEVLSIQELDSGVEADWDARAKLAAFLGGQVTGPFLLCRTSRAGVEGTRGACAICSVEVVLVPAREAFMRPGAKLACMGCLGAIPAAETILGPRPFTLRALEERARMEHTPPALAVAVEEVQVEKFECPCGQTVTGQSIGAHKRHHAKLTPAAKRAPPAPVAAALEREAKASVEFDGETQEAATTAVAVPEKRTYVASPDLEAQAIATAVAAFASLDQALACLDEAPRARVLRYLGDRFPAFASSPS